MLDTSIAVKTENFDGPLSLLLLLIQKEEMDVKSLDLTRITSQYLSYILKLEEMNFDMAGDYLYLAATLVFLKSKTCLTEEDELKLKSMLGDSDLAITSQAELIRRLEELARFQLLSQKLWSLPKLGEEVFAHPRIDRKAIIDSILTPMDLDKLTSTMIDLFRREKRKYTVVKRDRLSIKEKLSFLKSFLKTGDSTTLEALLDSDGNRSSENVVITFISLLELARLKKIGISQDEPGKMIYVNVVDDLENFDVNSADGFEPEEEVKEKNAVMNEEDKALAEMIIHASEEIDTDSTPIQ